VINNNNLEREPLISIITVVYNNVGNIKSAIHSVINQNVKNFEYIIIDGKSDDGTLEIINEYLKAGNISLLISEKDKGIFDALNKGIQNAKGKYIGFLHSDDIFAANNVIQEITKCILINDPDAVYGDLTYVKKNDVTKVVRYWKSSTFRRAKLKWGWMPPHPTFYLKKKFYNNYGLHDINLSVNADYDLMIRMLKIKNFNAIYLPKEIIKMRLGGNSNKISNLLTKSLEDYRVIKANKIGGILTLIFKNVQKVPQFFKKK
jgi:glycosyltransferase